MTNQYCIKLVSGWLLLNAILAIFHLYHGKNKLIFNDIMMMRSALYKSNTLSLIFIVLAHWNNSPRIDMLPHSDTLSWFRANQSLLFLINAACLAEKRKIQILYSLWFDPIRARTQDLLHSSNTLTITPLMRFEMKLIVSICVKQTYPLHV